MTAIITFVLKVMFHVNPLELYFPMLTRGYSEKIRVLLGRSRTYDLSIASSDTLPLS